MTNIYYRLINNSNKTCNYSDDELFNKVILYIDELLYNRKIVELIDNKFIIQSSINDTLIDIKEYIVSNEWLLTERKYFDTDDELNETFIRSDIVFYYSNLIKEEYEKTFLRLSLQVNNYKDTPFKFIIILSDNINIDKSKKESILEFEKNIYENKHVLLVNTNIISINKFSFNYISLELIINQSQKTLFNNINKGDTIFIYDYWYNFTDLDYIISPKIDYNNKFDYHTLFCKEDDYLNIKLNNHYIKEDSDSDEPEDVIDLLVDITNKYKLLLNNNINMETLLEYYNTVSSILLK